MLNMVKDIKKTKDIRRLLTKRIQLWDDRKYDETIHEAEMCDKMLPKRSTNVSDDEAVKIFDRLVMQGKLRSACRFITE